MGVSLHSWAGRACPRYFRCRTTQMIFMRVSPVCQWIFGAACVQSARRALPRSLLPPTGECSHCCPRFGEFKDPQRSKRRCRTVSMCSQEQPWYSLFKTCNGGSGRWVTLASGSSSMCQLLVRILLTWINLKFHVDVNKNILRGGPKGRRKDKKRKHSEK